MNERLTLQDLIDLLAEKKNITKKEAENFLRELINLVTETIQDKDFVRIKDFGTFKLTLVSARKSVNVNTGEDINIPPHYRLSFTPDKLLREGVNKPFAHFESVLLNDDVDFSDLDVFNEGTSKEVIENNEELEDDNTDIEDDFTEVEDIVEEETIITDFENISPTTSNHKNIIEKEIIVFEEINPQENTTNHTVSNIIEKTTITEIVTEKEEEKIINKTIIEKEEEIIKEQILTEEPQPLTSNNRSTFVEKDESINNQEILSQKEKYEDDEIIDFEQLLHKDKEKKKKLTIGAGILVASIFVIWLYFNLFSNKDTLPNKTNIPQLAVIDEDSSNQNKNIDDTTVSNNPKTNIPDNRTATELANSQQTSSNVAESKKVTVKSGQTMNSLGREYLGHPTFWVYIFEENTDKLKSPDAIYAGMEINIPDPKKYDIDPKNEESVKKAKILASEIVKKYE